MNPFRKATWAGGFYSLESIPGLLKHLQIRAQYLDIDHYIYPPSGILPLPPPAPRVGPPRKEGASL
jgi:hypothetical protein